MEQVDIFYIILFVIICMIFQIDIQIIIIIVTICILLYDYYNRIHVKVKSINAESKNQQFKTPVSSSADNVNIDKNVDLFNNIDNITSNKALSYSCKSMADVDLNTDALLNKDNPYNPESNPKLELDCDDKLVSRMKYMGAQALFAKEIRSTMGCHAKAMFEEELTECADRDWWEDDPRLEIQMIPK